jgi:hypothetical protein
MYEMSLHDPLGHLKHKLWPKKRSGVKLLGIAPNFFVCKWLATYRWKALNEGYNFVLKLISIGGLHTKLWAPKIVEVPAMGISKLPFGSLGTK